MKQLLIHTTIAALAGALNDVVVAGEAAWVPGRLEIRADNVAVLLSQDVSRQPQASGAIIGFKVLEGPGDYCQAELEKLKLENPYHEAVAVGICDFLEASELDSEKESATPEAAPPAAKKAAKKAAKNSARKSAKKLAKTVAVGPAFDVVVLVALRQP